MDKAEVGVIIEEVDVSCEPYRLHLGSIRIFEKKEVISQKVAWCTVIRKPRKAWA